MIRRSPARLWRDRGGVAATEAALAISLVLVPLALGVIDVSLAIVDTARLDRALQAAVFYVWNNPTSFNVNPLPTATTSALSTAATNGYGSNSPTLTVSAATACMCVSSGYIQGAAVSCTGSCSAGQTVAMYATITVSATFTLPVTLPYVGSSVAQSLSGVIRTQ
jgi:Flp pilus assembly protein TadG